VSQENVELVREIHRLWNAQQSAGHLIDAQMEYVNPSYAIESGVRHGRDALATIREVYPDFHIDTERFIDAGDDVVVIGLAGGTSTSGVQVKWRQGYIWTVRDGIAVRVRWFNDPAEALAAAGIAE